MKLFSKTEKEVNLDDLLKKSTRKKALISYLIFILKIIAWVFLIIPLWTIYILSFFIPYGLPIWLLLWFIFTIFKTVQKMYLRYYVKGNTITYGGRGKGKGMIFQEVINSEEKVMSNIDFGFNCKVLKPGEYYNSITPNTALKFLKGDVTIIEKIDHFEGVPYYLDDGALYFPNYNDQAIKILYPSITLKLPALRHLYGTYNPIQAQSIERLYKPLRELQDDGYIKAIKTIGKSWLWRKLPIVRKYFYVKWRYYENLDSALQGLLPWSKMGITNEIAQRVYMTTASALKEQFTAQHGLIHQSGLWIKRKTIKYDTRYYHYVFFGITFKEWQKNKKDQQKEKLLSEIASRNALKELKKVSYVKEKGV